MDSFYALSPRRPKCPPGVYRRKIAWVAQVRRAAACYAGLTAIEAAA
jgi:hypothetical protein